MYSFADGKNLRWANEGLLNGIASKTCPACRPLHVSRSVSDRLERTLTLGDARVGSGRTEGGTIGN